jgi:hypothetical protein
VNHWRTHVDLYCERLDPGFWAEPLNAVSNAAFIVAAAYAFMLWRRAGGRDRPALGLVLVTLAVGIGSFLFHTFAERWSLYADVIPITAFIYAYLMLALRRFVGLGLWAALAVTAGFAAFNVLFAPGLRAAIGPGALAGLNGSESYFPAALALAAIGGYLAVAPGTQRAGRALLLGAGVFLVSLAFRTLDQAACAALPLGTHFVWHLLNGLLLFILLRAAILAGPRGGGSLPPLANGCKTAAVARGRPAGVA